MRLEFTPRRERSLLIDALSPVAAILLTMLAALLLLWLAGYDAFSVTRQMFLDPVLQPARWPDLGVKAAPLALIAIGLAIGFRANVWNIGAEGQYIMGAIAGTGIALMTANMQGAWILPAMLIAGVLGGMAWAAIPALLKTRLSVNEILVSLMLTYVAVQFLFYLVRGPWKDPKGFNFPQTIMFSSDQTMPAMLPGSLLHWGFGLMLIVAIIVFAVMRFSIFGFGVRVMGEAPLAARLGGFSQDRITFACLAVGGGMAGLAGIIEAAGPFGQLTPQFPQNYGFTAIIVAFLGRLNPLGCVAAALALAVTYIGGEIAQSTARLPAAAIGVFQAMLLFILIAMDALTRWHIKLVRDTSAKGTAS
jgi:general nucleoside transport system permease protein